MLKKNILFSLVLMIAALAWNYFSPTQLHSPAAEFIVMYFFSATTLVHMYLMRTNDISPKNFVRAYMGSTALRLMINLLVIIAYIVIDRSGAMKFALTFLLFYFLYLIFEIAALQNDLKKK